ncbi:MAG: HD domain-containing protein, partial [Spirochaetaceae bacterium]|nr:HD domain-containing protein [Spirochaetaceae bacterium]
MNTENALEDFFKEFPFYTGEARNRITDAWIWMTGLREEKPGTSGEEYMEHPLRVAVILAQLKMDEDTIISAFLHNILAADSAKGAEIEAKFGTPVLKIVTGTSWITSLKINNPSLHQAEVIRKMFFAMIEDIRVILVKLADRLDRMRNLKNIIPDKQKIIAHEVIDIWAPLANRLGISAVKDELEDLSLKFSAPDIYEQIKQIVASKKGERAVYLENARQAITEAAAREGI